MSYTRFGKLLLLLVVIEVSYPQESINHKFSIPADHIMSDRELLYAVKDGNPQLEAVYRLRDDGDYTNGVEELIRHLKLEFGDRFYFNWKNFSNRLEKYMKLYPEAAEKHQTGSDYFLGTYSDDPKWELPCVNLKGEAITAYQLRHLARQSWAGDIVLSFAITGDSDLLEYILSQVASLNAAFEAGAYDDEGNGIYETFRAGKRIHQWLFAHQVFLSSEEYSVDQQILMIKTLLHHGAQLQERTERNRYGNHHTKGLVALFEIASVLPEFSSTKVWIDQAVEGLVWHIEREINPDGFQFERSVHYHIGDIENYFRVYQLANRNNIELPPVFNERLYQMFEALVKLAQPNRRLPVLQDDTDQRFAENNKVTDAMFVGTALFNDSQFKYFIDGDVSDTRYWLFSDEQLAQVAEIEDAIPEYTSCSLPSTGYFTMRNGWDDDSEYMTISAGVSEHKPDHQHGDVLGVVAWANGHEILPNYQVKYSYPDYPQWKNSWAKNVALVDSIPLGRDWKGNRGGSGFGKWLKLPEPKIIDWVVEEDYDYFIGSHDGFREYGVEYTREVIFIKVGFWLVRDHFKSDSEHNYQQVWQGSYQDLGSSIIKTYTDGSGLLIKQLIADVNYKNKPGRIDPKDHMVVEIEGQSDFSFTSLLLPFPDRDQLVDKSSGKLLGWELGLARNSQILSSADIKTDAVLGCGNSIDSYFLFELTRLESRERYIQFTQPVSIMIAVKEDMWQLNIIGDTSSKVLSNSKDIICIDVLDSWPCQDSQLEPGAVVSFLW